MLPLTVKEIHTCLMFNVLNFYGGKKSEQGVVYPDENLESEDEDIEDDEDDEVNDPNYQPDVPCGSEKENEDPKPKRRCTGKKWSWR